MSSYQVQILSWWHCLGTLRRCSPAGGNMSLEVDFENVNPHLLLHACGLRCGKMQNGMQSFQATTSFQSDGRYCAALRSPTNHTGTVDDPWHSCLSCLAAMPFLLMKSFPPGMVLPPAIMTVVETPRVHWPCRIPCPCCESARQKTGEHACISP